MLPLHNSDQSVKNFYLSQKGCRLTKILEMCLKMRHLRHIVCKCLKNETHIAIYMEKIERGMRVAMIIDKGVVRKESLNREPSLASRSVTDITDCPRPLAD